MSILKPKRWFKKLLNGQKQAGLGRDRDGDGDCDREEKGKGDDSHSCPCSYSRFYRLRRWTNSWRWKWPKFLLRFSLVDGIAFHVLSVVEAIVLVSAFCFFFCCCGCHV